MRVKSKTESLFKKISESIFLYYRVYLAPKNSLIHRILFQMESERMDEGPDFMKPRRPEVKQFLMGLSRELLERHIEEMLCSHYPEYEKDRNAPEGFWSRKTAQKVSRASDLLYEQIFNEGGEADQTKGGEANPASKGSKKQSYSPEKSGKDKKRGKSWEEDSGDLSKTKLTPREVSVGTEEERVIRPSRGTGTVITMSEDEEDPFI